MYLESLGVFTGEARKGSKKRQDGTLITANLCGLTRILNPDSHRDQNPG
jgi:hypothetical protein